MNDDKSSEQGERYRALFEAFLRSTRIGINRKGGQMQRARTRSPYRRFLRNRNDIYP